MAYAAIRAGQHTPGPGPPTAVRTSPAQGGVALLAPEAKKKAAGGCCVGKTDGFTPLQ